MDPAGEGEECEFDALFDGRSVLLDDCRHLGLGPAVQHRGRGAQAAEHPGDVESGVAAADHSTALAGGLDGVVVGVDQELQARLHQRLTVDAHAAGLPRPGGHEYDLEAGFEIGEGQSFAESDAVLEPDAHGFETGDLLIDHRRGKPVLGDAIAQHPSGERL